MRTRRYALTVLAGGAAVVLVPSYAQADYPNRPINYIVPFAAGGLTDTMARIVGKNVGDAFRQTVIIDNRPGANANLGAELAVRAAPDGYTWLAITLTHAVNQSLFPQLSYNLEKNLAPVAHLATSPLVLVVNVDNPAKTLQEFLTNAKGKSLNAGSSGNGSPPHLGLELLMINAKINAQHIPYKGGAPSLNDLLGNRLDFIVSNLPESEAYIKAGKLRALAVTSTERNTLLPDVPTFAEAGLPGMNLENWTGLVVPAGTPSAVIDKIASEAIKAVHEPDVQKRLLAMGFVPTGLGPAAFGAVIHKDVARWRKIIKERHITAG